MTTEEGRTSPSPPMRELSRSLISTESTSSSTKLNAEIMITSTVPNEAEGITPPPPQEELSRSLTSTKTTITSTSWG